MRTPFMMIVTAVTSLAIAAPLLSAETEAPATEEGLTVVPAGTICSPVVITSDVAQGTCAFHLVSDGNIDFTSHNIFGEALRARCEMELEGAVNTAGEGWVGQNQISISDPPSGGVDCTGAGAIRSCDMTEAEALGTGHNENWHVRTVEDHTNGDTWLEISLCLTNLDPFNSPVGGDLWLRVNETLGQPTSLIATDHRLRNIEAPLAVDAEFTGAFDFVNTATHPGITISH